MGLLTSQPFLMRRRADGRKEVSWRLWVLVWVVPVLFAAAALWLGAVAVQARWATVPATGEVMRVYSWKGETIFDRRKTLYSPLYRYTWSDGSPTEATAGMSHEDWNFAIGSRHAIRYFPGRKADIVKPGPHNWSVAAVMAAIALVTALPALWATRALRRWQTDDSERKTA